MVALLATNALSNDGCAPSTPLPYNTAEFVLTDFRFIPGTKIKDGRN
jgi:hypothetical protein